MPKPGTLVERRKPEDEDATMERTARVPGVTLCSSISLLVCCPNVTVDASETEKPDGTPRPSEEVSVIARRETTADNLSMDSKPKINRLGSVQAGSSDNSKTVVAAGRQPAATTMQDEQFCCAPDNNWVKCCGMHTND